MKMTAKKLDFGVKFECNIISWY